MSASISVSLLGHSFGTVSGNLHQGIGFTINLFIESGSLFFHIGNGNELMVKVALSGVYNANDDIPIIAL